MQAPNNLDHNILLELGFHLQTTPHAEGANVYSRKNGICRGDVFLLKKPTAKDSPNVYEVRIASYYEDDAANEYLREIISEEDLKNFFEFGLQVKIQ